jgi:hypothetical protein
MVLNVTKQYRRAGVWYERQKITESLRLSYAQNESGGGGGALHARDGEETRLGLALNLTQLSKERDITTATQLLRMSNCMYVSSLTDRRKSYLPELTANHTEIGRGFMNAV